MAAVIEAIGQTLPKGREKPKKDPSVPKVRGSCDACSNSKVKCDKERPSCRRCINSKVNCNYSRSLRAGKTPTANRGLGAKNIPGRKQRQASLIESSSTAHSSREGMSTTFTDETPTPTTSPKQLSIKLNVFSECTAALENEIDIPYHDILDMTGIESGEGHQTDPDQMQMDDNLFDYSSKSNLWTSQSLVSNTFNFQDFLIHHDEMLHLSSNFVDHQHTNDTELQQSLNSLTKESGSTDSALPSPNFSYTPSPTSDFQGHDCTRLAKSTLSCIRDLPTGDTLPTSAPAPNESMPTIDQALTANQTAMKHMATILNCLCSQDPYLPFILAVIGSKVLAWYQAIACPNTSPFATSNSLFVSVANVSQIPLTIGMYQLDREDEEKMKIQLVLSKLRTMETLVEKFGNKFCRGGRSTDREWGVYSALETFLQARLRETLKELKDQETSKCIEEN
jgi:Aflatoxin regulatory protein/Fungal Zn(2)-Cys(6) binuclear cluster domain